MANPIDVIVRLKLLTDGFLGNLKAAGAAVAAYLGFAAFAGGVRGAAELEAALSEVKAVSGATADEMKALRTAAEAAGSSTKYTATEAAGALGNLARAGMSSKDAIAALPGVLALAQAGGVDLGRASEFATKTMSGFGLAATDVARIADVLAKGANASNTSVTGLAEAMSYAAPMAKTVGLSLEQAVAIVGKFADAGIDASRAGTALNAILAQFNDTGSKFSTELRLAGVTSLNFGEALRQLAAKGAAGEQAIQAVGLEAGPALRALLNQGIGALDDLTAKLKDAGGSAAETAATMDDNLLGSLKSLSSGWDTLRNALFTPVLPVLKKGVDELIAALREAVASGVVGRFGEALARGFESALEWGRKFAAEVDFEKLAQRLRDYADQAGQAFADFQEKARNAGDVVRVSYGVMAAGFNVVLAVVYKIGESFAGVASNIQAALSIILTGLSKITFGGLAEGFAQAAESVRISAGATWAASEALARKSAQALLDATKAAEMARAGWAGLTEEQQANADASEAGAAAMAGVTKALEAAGTAAKASGAAVQEAATGAAVASRAAAEAIAAMRAEYQTAVDAGDWQRAAEIAQKIADATKKAAEGTREQANAAKNLDAAFSDLGIRSTESLQRLEASAKRSYETIRDSGKASAADISNAFEVYAKRAIEANNGVASATLKAEAAARGFTVTVNDAGQAIVTKMGQAAAALEKITGYYAGIGQSLNEVRVLQDALTAATLRQRDAIDAAVEAQNRLLDSVAAEKALRDRIRNTDANGFAKDSTGTTVVNAEGATPLSILNVLKGYGLNDAQAAAAARQFTANGQVVFSNQYNASTLSEALRRAAEAVLLSQGVNAGASSGGSSAGSSGSTGTSPGGGSGSDVVTLPGSGGSGPGINTDRYSSAQSGGVTAEQLQALIDAARSQSAPQVVQVTLPNGQVARVGTASAADSAALVGLLGAVQADARRAM